MSLSQQRVPGSSTVTLPALPQAQSNSSVNDMNSIYSAVIKVFRGEGLQMNELYFLNQSIRWLLKTEMGSFIEEYFQNQLLNKGLRSILEEVQLYEGEDQLFFLADVWIRFFSEILPTLQAIFYPLQGHEFTVRQMALLAFRDLVLMRLPLEELLHTNLSLLPTSIRQMLLVLQGVHEPRGPSMEYFRLEKMLEMVVSPYLWNCKHKSYEEEIRERKHLIQPEIRITQHISEVSLLTPLLEQEGEGHMERGNSLRRHSVSDGRSVITDMQLLTVTSRMHSGSEEACGTNDEMRKKDKRDRSQVSPTFESQSC
ncbi:proline-rich protein 5-like isoform X1 [Pangasianodon hypophthalmus]|uniref:proline-rich protein 5-like isoform X1 n=2 Tax=Pangasianodon hypophthalmus TaxID=310915 RepID=UPI000F00040E|nr:proline-rich protein 5-like isoform X1 [Pangasianodon hypophthalmus]XP_026793487.1 proline-rich protein 5-like isoform X1 [Pangasianodon hypophthalmus]XP_026793488.1 proline-rich protein 5-like isoform X1 [Pangasianodon hypophthalmus]XP_026793489.1 proline-rich protein 5-like isoform X1 [Pangasianodon hypophthalmus]